MKIKPLMRTFIPKIKPQTVSELRNQHVAL